MHVHVEPREGKLWPFVLKAAILGLVLATVLPALSFVGMSAMGALLTKTLEFESAPTIWDVAKASFLFCPLTLVWYGPFGFISGAAGGAFLYRRKERIQTFRRLILESAVLGVVAAVVFPLYNVATSPLALRYIKYQYSPVEWLAILFLSLLSFMFGAIALRKQFAREH